MPFVHCFGVSFEKSSLLILSSSYALFLFVLITISCIMFGFFFSFFFKKETVDLGLNYKNMKLLGKALKDVKTKCGWGSLVLSKAECKGKVFLVS